MVINGVIFRDLTSRLMVLIRLHAVVILARVLLFGWAAVGYQIVIRPDFGVAGMVTRVTGIHGELYGMWILIAMFLGMTGRLGRSKLLIAQIPIWLHLGLTMIYKFFELEGNAFALPVPTYASISVSLFILAMVLDD